MWWCVVILLISGIKEQGYLLKSCLFGANSRRSTNVVINWTSCLSSGSDSDSDSSSGSSSSIFGPCCCVDGVCDL